MSNLDEFSKVNIPGFDIETAKEYSDGDFDSCRVRLMMVGEYMPELIDNCKNYIANGDYKGYTVEIHAIKGNVLGAGFKELSAKAKDQEMAGKEGRFDYIKETCEGVFGELLKMAADIRDYLANN